jgi:hypothetical protein
LTPPSRSSSNSAFHTPKAISAEPKDAPANTLGIRRVMFVVDDIDDVIARLRPHGAELVGPVRARRVTALRGTLRSFRP